MVNCPLCDAHIDVEDDELDEGDSLVCEECGANLNVLSVNPLEIEAEDEDMEDEEEDDDDYRDEEDEEEEEEENW